MRVINDRVDLDKYRDMVPGDAHFIRDLAYYGDRVKRSMFDPDRVVATELPWDKCRGHFELRPGELTVWAGINGTGKSTVVSQVALWGARQSKWCIASMEMQPEDTIERMVCMGLGTKDPAPRGVDEIIQYGAGRIWLYDKQATVDYGHMMKVINYVRYEYGIEHFVIDSLMKCDKRGATREVKTTAQIDFVNDLATYARDSGMHIHLVHHMRKGERESRMPDKFDVRGASEIVDMADNLVIVHKHAEDDDQTELPTHFLRVAKQRHGRFEGKFSFWQADCLQWVERPDKRPMMLF